VLPGRAEATFRKSFHSIDSAFRARRRSAQTAPDGRDASTGAMLPVVSIACGGPSLVEVEGVEADTSTSTSDMACGCDMRPSCTE
jgi:hypothetical protein